MGTFIQELKRRNVIKAVIAYVVVAWVLLQVLSIVLPNVGAPEWVMKTIMTLMVVCFPIWVLISWVYEVTPAGLKKTKDISKDQSITATTNKRLNVLILVGIVAAIVVSFVNRSNFATLNSNDRAITLDRSIAVLPFDDMSSESDSEWFCDGVTEDILTNLSKLAGLKVISRTSTERYKNTDKSIPEIAAELGVSYLLEGSVRRHENKVIITAQLIDANDQHIWSENYSDDFKEVFKIQQDVSKKIVNQLHIALSPEEEKVMTTVPTNNIEAYQLVLKGRDLILNADEREDLEKSVSLYEQAIALDANYAEAYAELAYGNLMLYFWNNLDEKFLKPSQENIAKALLINPNTGRAYVTRAIIHDEINDAWEQSDKDYKKALKINPNDATAHYEYGLHNNLKPEEDIEKYLFHINKAQELDPLSSIINREKVTALARNNLFVEAETHLNKIKSLITQNQAFDLKARIESSKHKDWSKSIEYCLGELKKHPNNRYLLSYIGDSYDGILNDDKNSVKYFKLAYQADSSHVNTARNYHNILVENGQFEEAAVMFDSDNYQNITTDLQKLLSTFYFHYHQGHYVKVQDILKDSILINRSMEKVILQAQLGNENEVYKLFKNQNNNNTNKAFAFAILKQRDSMYYYLNEKNVNNSLVNSRQEFNPYRKEAQYIAFLEKSNFPIDKQNQ